MSIRSSCHHLTISTLWLAAATSAASGCVLLNPSFGSTGASATEATSDDVTTTGEDSTTTGEDSTSTGATTGTTTDAETSTTALTTSTTALTTSSTGLTTSTTALTTETGSGTGDLLCPECAAEKLACEANPACAIVNELAEDCDYDRVCINNQACETLPIAEAAEGLTLWAALERCDADECMELPPPVCVAEQEACYANPACAAMTACVTSQCSCIPGDAQIHCWADCGKEHPAGVEDWQAWIICVAEESAGDGQPTPPMFDAYAP